ncbi:uncharacterized protein [Cicer arietinum]|uniref:uncharacterized protein n=1 Tax=Cicer arietinum TaxID=3827 RepID=UPI003CC54415
MIITCFGIGFIQLNILHSWQMESNVKRNVNALAVGMIVGIDHLEQISQRCICIVKSVAVDHSGCVLCHDFVKLFGPRTKIICDQCEKEYHVGCFKDYKMQNLEVFHSTLGWFLGC